MSSELLTAIKNNNIENAMLALQRIAGRRQGFNYARYFAQYFHNGYPLINFVKSPEMLTLLVTHGAKANVRDNDGKYLFDYLFKGANLDLLKKLLLLENIGMKDELGSYVLTLVKEEKFDQLEIILAYAARKNINNLFTWYSTSTNYFSIHYLVASGNVEMLRYLVLNGADANKKINKSEQTCLDLAIEKNRVEVVRYLCTIDNITTSTLLKLHIYHAIKAQNGQMAKILIEYAKKQGIDYNLDYYYTTKNNINNFAIHHTILNADYFSLDLLIKNNANINLRNSANKTPIELAFDKAHYYLAIRLLECDDLEITPLLLQDIIVVAANNNNLELCQAALAFASRKNIQLNLNYYYYSKENRLPIHRFSIHLASAHQNFDMCRLLAERKANPYHTRETNLNAFNLMKFEIDQIITISITYDPDVTEATLIENIIRSLRGPSDKLKDYANFRDENFREKSINSPDLLLFLLNHGANIKGAILNLNLDEVDFTLCELNQNQIQYCFSLGVPLTRLGPQVEILKDQQITLYNMVQVKNAIDLGFNLNNIRMRNIVISTFEELESILAHRDNLQGFKLSHDFDISTLKITENDLLAKLPTDIFSLQQYIELISNYLPNDIRPPKIIYDNNIPIENLTLDDLKQFKAWLQRYMFKIAMIKQKADPTPDCLKFNVKNEELNADHLKNFKDWLILHRQKLDFLKPNYLQDLNFTNQDCNISELTNEDLLHFRNWLQTTAEKIAPLGDIHPITIRVNQDLSKISQVFNGGINLKLIQDLLDLYFKHSHSKYFSFAHTDGVKKLRQFVAELTTQKVDPNETLSSENLNKLYSIICQRGQRLVKHPDRDYFHQPYKYTNQLYFVLIWLMGRNDGYKFSEMIPSYDESVWQQIALSGIDFYSVPFAKMYRASFQKRDHHPMLYNVEDIIRNLVETGKLIRVYDPAGANHQEFTAKETKELFATCPTLITTMQEKHEEELKQKASRGDIVSDKTLNELYRFGEDCWNNSTDSGGTFSQEKAQKIQERLRDYMEKISKEERNKLEKSVPLYVECRHGKTTIKQLFSEMTYGGCSGQLGKAFKQYVTAYREHYANRNTTKYSEYLQRFGSLQCKQSRSVMEVPVTQDITSQHLARMVYA